MGEVKNADLQNVEQEMSEDDISMLYESIRAAEKNPDLAYPYAAESVEVQVDWDALERRALAPAWPEVVHSWFDSISVPTVAWSIIFPILGMFTTFFWLRDVPVEGSTVFALRVVGATVVMVFLFMWAALSIQAMGQLSIPEPAYELRPVQQAPAQGPRLKLEWMVRPQFSLRHTFAWGTVTALVISGFVHIAVQVPKAAAPPKAIPSPSPSPSPSALHDAASFYFGEDNVERGGRNLLVVLQTDQRGTVTEKEDLLKAADLPYSKLMALSSSDPDAAQRRKELTEQAIAALEQAAEIDPKRAAVWTRLAEVHFQNEQIALAKQALSNVRPDAPPQELARATMIAAVINAYDVSTTLAHGNPTAEEKKIAAGQLAATIKKVEAATEDGEASPVLTHLHLVHAAVADDPTEKEASEQQAMRTSLVALRLPQTSVNAVERPVSFARDRWVFTDKTTGNAQQQNLITTVTSRDQSN